MSWDKSLGNSSIEIMLIAGLERPAAWAGNGLVSMFWETGEETVTIPFSIKFGPYALRRNNLWCHV